MKTINIFLASSEELDYYRMVFGNLVRRLDNVYEKRGVRIRLFEWEDYDAAYNDRRKQDEYNDFARRSDMFIAMFGTVANKFTLEEFDVALDEYRNNQLPKIYVYCKDLPEGEEKNSLTTFKKRLKDDLQYYWCHFDNNRDRIQLHFVMQLQLFESARMDELKLEDGIISLGGLTVAHMDKLKFASANEEYQKLSKKIAELSKEIVKKTNLTLSLQPKGDASHPIANINVKMFGIGVNLHYLCCRKEKINQTGNKTRNLTSRWRL